jgi:hypothetical protein
MSMSTPPLNSQQIVIQQVSDTIATTTSSSSTTSPTSTLAYKGTYEVLDGIADPSQKGKIKLKIDLGSGQVIEKIVKIKVGRDILTNLEEVKKIVKVYNETLVMKHIMDGYVQAAKDLQALSKGTGNMVAPRLHFRISESGIHIDNLDSTKLPTVPAILINNAIKAKWSNALHNADIEIRFMKEFKAKFKDTTPGIQADALKRILDGELKVDNKETDALLKFDNNKGLKAAIEKLHKEAEDARGRITLDRFRSKISDEDLKKTLENLVEKQNQPEVHEAEIIDDSPNKAVAIRTELEPKYKSKDEE